MDRSVLARKPMTELKDIASHLNMRGFQKLRKAELIDAIVESATGQAAASNGAPATEPVAGADDDGQRTTRTRTRSTTERGDDPKGPDVRDPEQGTAQLEGDTARKVLPPSAREGGGGQDEDEGSRRTRSRNGGNRSGGQSRSERGKSEQGKSEQGKSEQGGSQQGGSAKGDGGSAKGDGGSAKGEGGSAKGDGGSTQTDRSEEGRKREQPSEEGGARNGSRNGGRNGGRDETSGKNSDQTSADDDDADADADGDDEESSANRKRRSRRDRRKRNRERNEQEGQQGNEPGEVRAGVLDILPEGYGFLRTTGYLPGDRDVYVSQGQIRKHALRRGDVVQGPIRQQRNNEKVPALHHVQKVNGGELEAGRVPDRVEFRDLVPVYPSEQMFLETDSGNAALRAIDLLAPIGRGQRALLLCPPAAGRTDVLKGMGQAIATNNPDAHLMVVLIDERPEDVTDVQRAIPGEVIASTFDRPVEDHTQIAELAMERARRLVELGHDVVVLVDSLTRLARAYGGGAVDATSLYPGKRFFGTARNIEDGGSLTIIAAVLTDSGSTTDNQIADEFLGAANTVIALDGDVAPHLRPAIRVDLSATRREELLVPDEDLSAIWQVRRGLADMPHQESTKAFAERLAATDDNEAFLDGVEPALDRHATMGTT